MDWRDRLQPGEIAGIAFHTESAAGTGGRRLAVHEYPLQNVHYVEDMGPSAGSQRLTVFLIGSDYDLQTEALITQLDSEGPHTLINPYRGTQRVQINTYDWAITSRRGGFAQFNIEYVLDGKRKFPVSANANAQQLEAACNSCSIVLQSTFAEEFSIDSQPGFIADAAIDQFADAADALGSINDQLANVMQLVDNPLSLLGSLDLDSFGLDGLGLDFDLGSLTDVLAVIDDPSALLNDIVGSGLSGLSNLDFGGLNLGAIGDTFGGLNLGSIGESIGGFLDSASPFTDQLLDFGGNIASLVLTPKRIAGSVTGLISNLFSRSSSFNSIFSSFKSLKRRFSDTKPIPLTTRTRHVQAANTTATVKLLRGVSVVETVRVVAKHPKPFQTYEQAIEVRDVLLAEIDELIETSTDAEYTNLTNLQTALIKRVEEVAPGLSKVKQIHLQQSIPALVLAHQLYGDVSKANDLITRNNVRHPSFMPAGEELEVLI